MSNKRAFQLVCTGLLVLHLCGVQSHSWITCTDYMTKNDDVYDVTKCRGWPRAANSKLPKTKKFAQDTGFDKKPSENGPCQASRNDNANYDSNHPMAVYYPGQQVVLAHPMKNHGADAGCTNIYIPDNGNYIYRGPANGNSDPTLSQFRSNLVFDLGKSISGSSNSDSSTYPKPGFQNAPAFCNKQKATTDNALGTYSFNVPTNLTPGRYTFMWLWAFNSAQDLYSTCYEVEIASSRQIRDNMLTDNGLSDLSEPCGGATSNSSIQGNCNANVVTSIPATTAANVVTSIPTTTCDSTILESSFITMITVLICALLKNM